MVTVVRGKFSCLDVKPAGVSWGMFLLTLLSCLSQSDPVLLQDEEMGRHVQPIAGLQAAHGAAGA